MTPVAPEQFFGPFVSLSQADGVVVADSPYAGPLAGVYERRSGGLKFDIAPFISALPSAPCEVLELGAGGGRLSVPIAAVGHRVTAVESSPAMITLLEHRRESEGLEERIVVATGSLFTPPAGPFDAVLVGAGMLPTFLSEGGDRWLRRLHRRLRSGGQLLFDTYEPRRIDAKPDVTEHRLTVNGREVVLLEGAVALSATTMLTNVYADFGDQAIIAAEIIQQTPHRSLDKMLVKAGFRPMSSVDVAAQTPTPLIGHFWASTSAPESTSFVGS